METMDKEVSYSLESTTQMSRCVDMASFFLALILLKKQMCGHRLRANSLKLFIIIETLCQQDMCHTVKTIQQSTPVEGFPLYSDQTVDLLIWPYTECIMFLWIANERPDGKSSDLLGSRGR